MRTGKVEICGVNTSRLKTLSEDEKHELLLRVKAGDKKAREALVTGNLRLVLSVVSRFPTKGESADDLFQVGCIGLIKAIDNFNTDYDVRFSTYAVPMIIGEIRRYLRDNNAIRVSRSVRDMAYRALQVREQILRETGDEPTVEKIAELLNADKKEVSEAMEAIVEPVSLYESAYNDGDDTMYVIDQIRDDGESDATWVENLALRAAYDKLCDREKKIIAMRFYDGKTQMEVAEIIGISQAQVSRLEKSAIGKIKNEM